MKLSCTHISTIVSCVNALILPIVRLFLYPTLGPYYLKQQMRFLKMHYGKKFIVTEKCMACVTFKICFMEVDVCANV